MALQKPTRKEISRGALRAKRRRFGVSTNVKSVSVALRIPAELHSDVCREAGGNKSAWIEEAIRQRVAQGAGGIAVADLPASARERVEAYVDLIRAALADEELSKLEAMWEREKDPNYYGVRARAETSLEASIDVLAGRGRSGRVPVAPGCQ